MAPVTFDQPVNLTRKDFVPNQEVRWCPGCGDYAILAQMHKLLPSLGVPREKVVFISGIGCSSRFPYYVETYGFHSIHGRAPTVASGVKCANPELLVWVITGDGDGLSIGGNHFLHVFRRNVNVNMVLFNNRIYGLTKGQASPTSEFGKRTKSTPVGTIEQPINPQCVALAAEASFTARCLDVDLKHMGGVLERAARHSGASFVEVYQNCVVFNDNAFADVSEKISRPEHSLYLEHGKPMVFGANMDKGIRLQGLRPEVVLLGNGVTLDDLLVHNETDKTLAYMLSQMAPPAFPTVFGVLYHVKKPTYEVLMQQQINEAIQKKGKGTLHDLLKGDETWAISRAEAEESAKL